MRHTYTERINVFGNLCMPQMAAATCLAAQCSFDFMPAEYMEQVETLLESLNGILGALHHDVNTQHLADWGGQTIMRVDCTGV